MKKALFLTLALAVGLGLCVNGAWAYTINDPSNDAIGVEFESYGINVLNYLTRGPLHFRCLLITPRGGLR